ncbi:MAG: 50S ribosomal protein L32 [Kiritimatiellaeota bacterium]|nr:50S ribosomal protein L32 [Kiritimatiellota bacterium]
MAVQQRRVSKQKTRQRKAANRYQGVEVGRCPTCGAPRLPHRVCRSCGKYGGRQVVSIKGE